MKNSYITKKLLSRAFPGMVILFLIALCVMGQSFESNADSLVFNPDIFSSDKPLQWSLTFDIRKFRNEKDDEEKLPATLTIYDDDSSVVQRNISIKARGESRKKICYFPPIKLNLGEASFDDAYLDTIKNHKLVTHCGSSKKSDQVLLKEYLVYKLFNLFSEKSFRVRLIKMKYIDSEEKVKTESRFAFLIEDSDVMAGRNQCLIIKYEKFGMKHIDRSSMILLSMFQYMIGNVDWTVSGLHNIKLIKSMDFTLEFPFAVPYDFDHAGFVDASYATNVMNPEIQSVKTRMFLGACYTKKEYDEIIKVFLNRKNEMYDLINNFDLLDDKSAKSIITYMDKFYKMIGQPNFYKKYISPFCINYDI
nr:hypothetical protein [Bacteroidota bacterium]